MIETRRLKNVVIFIQTVLSFVLSRKIITHFLYLLIANNGDNFITSFKAKTTPLVYTLILTFYAFFIKNWPCQKIIALYIFYQ